LTKRKLAVALISNCHTFSSRETLIKDLRAALRSIAAANNSTAGGNVTSGNAESTDLVSDNDDEYAVDVYGRCGDEGTMAGDGVDMAYLSKRYKFFLAFENSLCEDYVTEKMFSALQYPWIPVVYGNADYSQVRKKIFLSVSLTS
jgi:hypothetical protein